MLSSLVDAATDFQSPSGDYCRWIPVHPRSAFERWRPVKTQTPPPRLPLRLVSPQPLAPSRPLSRTHHRVRSLSRTDINIHLHYQNLTPGPDNQLASLQMGSLSSPLPRYWAPLQTVSDDSSPVPVVRSKAEIRKLDATIRKQLRRERPVPLDPQAEKATCLPPEWRHHPRPPTPDWIVQRRKRLRIENTDMGDSDPSTETQEEDSDLKEWTTEHPDDHTKLQHLRKRPPPPPLALLGEREFVGELKLPDELEPGCEADTEDPSDEGDEMDMETERQEEARLRSQEGSYISASVALDQRDDAEIEAATTRTRLQYEDFFYAVPSGTAGLDGKLKLMVHDESVEGGTRLATVEESQYYLTVLCDSDLD